MDPSNLTQMDQSFSQTLWCFSVAYYKTKCLVLVHSPQSVAGAVLPPMEEDSEHRLPEKDLLISSLPYWE